MGSGGVNIPLVAAEMTPRPATYQPIDPLEEFQRASALKTEANQQQMQQIQLQQAQQAQKDQAAMTQAMHDWDGKDFNSLPALLLKNGGSANAVFNVQNQILQHRTQLATLDKDTLANRQAHNDAQLGALQAASQVPDEDLPNHLTSTAQDLLKNGHLDPEHMPQVQQIAALAATDPAAARKQLSIYEKGLMGEKEQFAQAQEAQKTAAEVAQKTAQSEAEMWKPAGEGTLVNFKTGQLIHGVAPVEQQAMQDYLNKNPGKGPSDFIAWKAKQSPMAMVMGNQLGASSPALDQAAQRYAETGVLPSGFARSPGTLTAIMNRAAELNPGTDIAGNSAVYSANKKALGDLQSQYSKVEAFEGTALKNLDLYVQKVKSIPDLGVRFANVPLRSITGTMIGEQNYAAMEAARKTAAAEVGKVLSSATGSGVLSDSQRKEAEDVLDGKLPLAATLQVVETLKQDLGNRHQSYNDEIGHLQGLVGGKNKTGNQTSAPANDFFSQFGGQAK